MNRTIIRAVGGAVTMAALVFGGAAPALAATPKTKHATKSHARKHNTNSSSSGTGETALTGATLTSASNAALAASSGATVDSATTETDSSLTGAAYEVHITKPDGSKAVVIEDSSFTVLATQAGGGCPGGGPGPHGQ